MQIYKDLYPARTSSADPGFPFGKAVDAVAEGSGTPVSAAWVNDFWGAFQAILADVGMTPNATPEKVGSSQVLDALKQIADNVVNGVGALRTREPRKTGETVFLSYHTAMSSGGGGTFRHDSSDTDTADDNGFTIVTAGGARWKRINTDHASPQMFGATVGGSNTTAMSAFIAHTGLPKKLTRSLGVSAPVVINDDNVSLEIPADVVLYANSGFSGDAVVKVGAIDNLVDNCKIYGEGEVDALDRCDKGVFVVRSRFSRVKLNAVKNVGKIGVQVGTNTAAGKCYEVDVHVPEVARSDTAAPADSIGVYHENCSDCNIDLTICRGFRKSFSNATNCAALWYTKCHGWSRPQHGPLTHVFDDNSALSKFTNCYADTPTNYGDPSITEVHGFYLNGYSPQLLACEAFINKDLTPTIETDGVINAVTFAKEIYANIFGFHCSGSAATRRFKAFVAGPRDGSNVLGLIDNGASNFVDTDSRRISFSNVKDVTFGRNVLVKDGVNVTGEDAAVKALRFQTLESNRFNFRMNEDAETGTVGGSLLQMQAFDNTGTLIGTIAEYSREFDQWQFSPKVKVGKSMILANYTVATLPDNDNRALVYVSDGNAGSPCLAVYSGGWKKVLIGDLVSAS